MKFKDVIKGIFGIFFLGALGILVWALFTAMVKTFGDYTSSVEPTIVVAIVSGLGAIIVNAISKNSERKSQIFMKSKEKMVEVYEAFLNDLREATDDEKSAIFKKYDSLFAVNASDDTYNEFIALKNAENKDTTRLIVSIRNELKVSNKKNKKLDNKTCYSSADSEKLDLSKGESMKSFKPNHILYVCLLLLFLAISLTSLMICMVSPWFTLVAGLGCGGFASVLVAWMVDAATCKANNKKAVLYQQEIFSELISSFETGIQPFIFECELLDENCKHQPKTWKEWLEFSYSICQDKNAFVIKYLVFERDISEKIKILAYQRAQLRHDGIIDESDCKAIAYIQSWCSLIETEYETFGSSDAFLSNFLTQTKALYLYLDKSPAMKQINDVSIKSLLDD